MSFKKCAVIKVRFVPEFKTILTYTTNAQLIPLLLH